MRASTSNSFYRAFLTLYNDEILNFRLSRHYSTEKSTKDAFVSNGQPDIEYHLIIERQPSTSSSPPIASTTDFIGTTEVIFEVSFNDFKNNDGWKTFAKDLIAYLTYGKSKGITENKHMNMNKQVIRLTEGDLHKIIKESVSKILTELDWKTYMNAARARQTQGNGDKASNLEAYANNQFNRQHFGDRDYYLSHEDVSQGNDLSVNAGLTANANMNGGYMKDERDYTSPMYGATMQTPWGNYREIIGRNKLAGGTVYHGFGKDYVKNGTGYAMKMKGGGGDHSQMLNRVNNDYKNKINSVGNDLDGYYNNKSKYVKGQGWQ